VRVEDVVYVRSHVLSVERVLVSLQIKGCGLCREDCGISVLATTYLWGYVIYVCYLCIYGVLWSQSTVEHCRLNTECFCYQRDVHICDSILRTLCSE
jgi:hypothetical protein